MLVISLRSLISVFLNCLHLVIKGKEKKTKRIRLAAQLAKTTLQLRLVELYQFVSVDQAAYSSYR